MIGGLGALLMRNLANGHGNGAASDEYDYEDDDGYAEDAEDAEEEVDDTDAEEAPAT